MTAGDILGRTERSARDGSAIVDCALYTDGVRSGGVVPLDDAMDTVQAAAEQSASGTDSFVWIGLHEPTSQQFETVARKFDLHPLAVEDAVHAHQRPKLENYGHTIFVVLKTVNYVDHEEVVEVGELMLFIGANFVVSVRHGEGSPLDHVRADLESNRDRLRQGSPAVLHAILDRVVDDYILAAEQVAEDIDEIECEVFSGDRNDHAERIYKLKREVMSFQRSVKPLGEPLRRLAAAEVPHLDEETAKYFRDVHDHLLRTADQVDGFSQLLNDILEANSAGVSMRQNEDMRKITAWVAILAWSTLIAGIYGMNFTHMPELHWVFGYPFALTIMALGSGWLYRAFRRNGWL